MRGLIIIVLVSVLIACVSHIERQEPVALDANSQFVLQPVPAELIGTARLEQLQITTAEQSHQLLLQIEIFAKQVKMVGFSLSGMVLFEISWDPVTGLQNQHKVPLGKLDPPVLFAYFQLANWPTKVVENGLRQMQLQNHNGGRQFYRGEQLIFTIRQVGQTTQFVHHLQHFQINIDRLKQWEINEQLD